MSYTSSIVFSFVLAALLFYPFCVQSSNVHIGNGLYLPDTNLMVPINSQYTIFEGDISRFLREEPLGITFNNKVFSRDTESLYREFSQTFGLNAQYRVVRISVEQSLQHIAGSETNVTALSIDVLTYSKKLSIRNEARTITRIPLREAFLQELRQLPEYPADGDSNWLPYLRFMRKWGSHYVNAVYYGSWFQQWSTASSTMRFTERQFQARACVAVEGVGNNFPSVEACAGVGEQEKRAASSLSMRTRLVVRGGEPRTASMLSSGQRTDELLQQFIKEGLDSTVAVRYQFTPLWTQVLAVYGMNTREGRIASAMEAYYEGFLAFGCPRMTTTNNIAMQRFRRSVSNLYSCERKCEGCSVAADCNRIGNSRICNCFGNSCIRLIEGNPDGRVEVQTRRDNLRQNEGPNRSCQFSGSSCSCVASAESNCVAGYRAIWNQWDALAEKDAVHAIG